MAAPPDAGARLRALAADWRVDLESVLETATSLVGFGTCGGTGVVLKVVRSARTEEWDAGAIAHGFAARGVVRVHEHVPGAVLMERLTPGRPLAEVVHAGRDDEASDVLVQVVTAMREVSPPLHGLASAETWGTALDRYAVSGDRQIAAGLLEEARDRYTQLCRTQAAVRVLHGDLQHYNVLWDDARGWVAIDPKGVVAELEYEFGAALRNPHGLPHLYTTPAAERRIGRMAAQLSVNVQRVIAWGFTQAVLAAVWSVEDDGAVSPHDPALLIAQALHPLLD